MVRKGRSIVCQKWLREELDINTIAKPISIYLSIYLRTHFLPLTTHQRTTQIHRHDYAQQKQMRSKQQRQQQYRRQAHTKDHQSPSHYDLSSCPALERQQQA